jgi:HD-GYP domain-containing protein (c-di-GMP phosphodiesterase class II)
MSAETKKKLTIELALILVVVGLTCLLYQMPGYKLIVLNLFYLPAMLGALYLGRYGGGVLALFCVVSAFVFTLFDMHNFAAQMSPLVIGMALTVWAAVLGLTTILVSTLSDERAERIAELHDAYVGIVEVLANYLNNADPRQRAHCKRISDLSCDVARRMKLTEDEVDNVRIAALLQEMENVEITARVIRKAIGDLGATQQDRPHTFHGTDLVQSLGTVLSRALPLLASVRSSDELSMAVSDQNPREQVPFGAEIIRVVQRYEELTEGTLGVPGLPQHEAVEELRNDLEANYHSGVLDALESLLGNSYGSKPGIKATLDAAEMLAASI